MTHQLYKERRQDKPKALGVWVKAKRAGRNRHERHVANRSGKKNTSGFPLGYNAKTWREQGAIKGA